MSVDSSRPGVGDVIFTAFKPIAKMAAITLGGAVLCRKGILSAEATRANAGILINLLLPMLIFSAVTTSFDASNIKSVVALVVTGVLYMFMGLAFGFLVRWLTPVPKTWKWGVLITGACSNVGDLPIAFVLTIAKSAPFSGEQDSTRGIAYASIFMVVQTLAMFSLGGAQLLKRDFRPVEESPDPEKAAATSSKLKSTVTAIANRTRKTVGLVSRRAGGRRQPPASPAVMLTCAAGGTARTGTSHSSEEGYKTSANNTPNDGNSIVEADRDRDVISPASISAHSIGSRTGPAAKETSAIARPNCIKRVWSGYIVPVFAPPSLSLIVGLIVANIPPLKALFVKTDKFDMPSAPDDKPPLDFIMEICTFGGSAVPVIGMLLLGANLSRMSIKNLPRGFWKSTVMMSVLKLVVSPIVGMLWTKMVMNRTGLIDPEEKMLQFILILCAGVPTATLQVYLTNIYATEGSVETSALSAMLLAQYSTMLLTLTILVSYTLSNAL